MRPRVAEARGWETKVERVRGSGPPRRAKAFSGWDWTLARAERRALGSSNQSGGSGRPPSPWQRDAEARARRGGGLGPALGNRTMSRPKVGVPRSPDAFVVLREGREATEAFRLGGPRGVIPDRVGGKR